MNEMIKAITLEALRQKTARDKSPDEFFGTTTLEAMVDAGLNIDLWRDQICETHDRYVGYIRPGDEIVTFCRGCLHRNVQKLYSREQTLEYIDALIRRGVDVPRSLQKALRVFVAEEA